MISRMKRRMLRNKLKKEKFKIIIELAAVNKKLKALDELEKLDKKDKKDEKI